VGKNVPTKLFRELVALGFLKVRKQGAYSLKTKEATEWELTAEPCGDQPPSMEYRGCKDVTFRWFYEEQRLQKPPYAELIENYGGDFADGFLEYLNRPHHDSDGKFVPFEEELFAEFRAKGYSNDAIEELLDRHRTNLPAEDLIDELFTEAEAALVKAYLDREYPDDETTIVEMRLPIPKNSIGFFAIGVGGGDGFYMLNKESPYDLPFKVWGYFDLVGCQLIDGSAVYHHRRWLISPNGEMRQQTNEEAAADDAAVADRARENGFED